MHVVLLKLEDSWVNLLTNNAIQKICPGKNESCKKCRPVEKVDPRGGDYKWFQTHWSHSSPQRQRWKSQRDMKEDIIVKGLQREMPVDFAVTWYYCKKGPVLNWPWLAQQIEGCHGGECQCLWTSAAICCGIHLMEMLERVHTLRYDYWLWAIYCICLGVFDHETTQKGVVIQSGVGDHDKTE